MASEIRVNKINSRTGVGTITLSPTGVDFTGIATVATLKATTGIVTTLTATTGIVTTLTVDTARTTTGIVTTLTADASRITTGIVTTLTVDTARTTTGIVTTLTADTAKVGAAVTISESGMEVTGVTTVTSSINIGSATTISSSSLEVNGVQYPTAGALSNRNLFINGDQKIDQRNNGSAVSLSSSSPFVTDRWSARINGGAATGQRVTDVPSGKGFVKSFKFDVTTADTSLGANDEIWLQQRIEARNLTQLRYGTSDAQSVTVSFWVKSALTGDFGFFVYQSDAARAYQTTYNIATANTWEYKTITIPGDSSGTINDDAGTGFEIRWYLGVGGNKGGSSNQNAWGTDATNRHPTGTNIMASTSNNWFITGIQLEVGEKATPFEHRIVGDELARCQRYYNMIANGNSLSIVSGAVYATNNFYSVYNFPVVMRSSPTLDSSSGTNYFDLLSDGVSDTFNAVLLGNSSANAAELRAHSNEGLSGATAGHAAWMRTNNSSAYIALTAEL